MTDRLLEILYTRYPLTAIPSDGMDRLKASGMTFTIRAYRAEGLGHVSVMKAGGFLGLMKMDTLIINPTSLDLPLYSYDGILAVRNDTRIVELYDTSLNECDLSGLDAVKSRYSDLPERDPGTHWYDSLKLSQSLSKKAKKGQSGRMDQMVLEHFRAYLAVQADPVTDLQAKREKTSLYVEGLLENGGPSTDVFRKALGEERTAELFRRILFGTVSD